MTLIECFTQIHMDNLAATLRLEPDRTVFLGDSQKMAAPIRRYRDLLEQRGIRTQLLPQDVRGMAIGQICQLLRELMKEEDAYVIDITGGEEPVILAVGAALGFLPEEKRRSVRVQRYDPHTQTVRDLLHGNLEFRDRTVSLTVAELVQLHGGTLFPDSYQPEEDQTPEDLQPLWDIVSDDPGRWNQTITALNELESYADSREQVFLLTQHLAGLKNFPQKEALARTLLEKLLELGILNGRISDHVLEYSFPSPMLRYCTMKAGNVLEVKTLLEARSIREEGKPFFQDCRMGVSIDWDGVVHDSWERSYDTRNEVDAVLIHGTTPLFVSCKNGSIGEEELYKLHTVATRFGGPNARKMLIATELNRKNSFSGQSFIQRAWDMDIFLVTDAAQLSHADWEQAFRQALG